MDRRSFFKYASFSGAMTAFLGGLHPALALTWQKIGTTSGIPGTWNKITVTGGGASIIGIASLAAGTSHSLALRSDGLVFACGNNTSGLLGDNTTVRKSTYVQAVSP